MRPRTVLACALAGLFGCSNVWTDESLTSHGPVTRSLANAAPTARHWMQRFSVATAPDACAIDESSALRCPSANATATISGDVVRRIQAAAADAKDADAMQALALVDLLSGDTAATALQRSIALLEATTRLAPSPHRFTDLAAARLAYSRSAGGAKALVEALDAAGRALALDSTNAVARYDYALALDMLGLDFQASLAWAAYLDGDSSSVYAAEARDRLRTLRALGTPTRPRAGSTAEQYTAFSRSAPGDAQLLAWEEIFPAWGTAHLQGDSSAAASALAAASAISSELEVTGRDSAVGNALRAIGAARERPADIRAIADGHVQFARAQAQSRVNAYAAADTTYRALLQLRPRSSSLMTRVSLAHTNALIYANAYDSALTRATRFIREHDGAREPLIHGRALWYVGVIELRKGHTDVGIEQMTRSMRYFRQAGDEESLAGAIGIVGEVLHQAGDAAAGFDTTASALRMMRGRPASLWRHNVLLVIGRASQRAGLSYAAQAIEAEDANGADSGPRLVSVVEAKLARAHSEWRNGHTADAARLAREARAAITRIADRRMQAQLLRDASVLRAAEILDSQPDSAAALLTAAIAIDRPAGFPVKLIPALVTRAAANIARRRINEAEADLTEAAAQYDTSRVALQRQALQWSVSRQARGVYDSLIMIRVRNGDSRGALAILERSRATFSPIAARRATSRNGARQDAVIAYALIGGELLTWTITDRDTAFARLGVPRAELSARIERVRSRLELGASDSTVLGDLGELHALLVQPMARRIAQRPLRIVADGELASVPFAALWNRATRRFLVEDHVVSLSPTVADAERPAGPSGFASGTVIVANPSLAGSQFARYPHLRGAAEEASLVAGLYPRANSLRGASADSAAFVAAIRDAGLIHFAGHAILDDAQPWRSVLAVRPHGISATSIASMDLHRVRLVVLSACETMRAPSGDAAGFAGMADAFLGAGAAGVVASLWRVDDDDTAPLMASFHRAYRVSGDAAGALRESQLALIAQHRPPAAWAAFGYRGR